MKCVRCKIEIDKGSNKNTEITKSMICTACENFYDSHNKLTCKTCGIEKPVASFYGAINTRTGYETSCKDCKKLSDAEKYKRRKERKKAMVEKRKLSLKGNTNCSVPCQECNYNEVSKYVFPDGTVSSICRLKLRPIQFIIKVLK